MDNFNVIDVCGDFTQSSTIHRKSGYIESLDYPRPSPANSACSCYFKTPPNATLLLSVLDGQKAPPSLLKWRPGGGDSSLGREIIWNGDGKGFVYTESDDVIISHRSSTNEREGGRFWLKYEGIVKFLLSC